MVSGSHPYRAGIVGAGMISDHHAQAVASLPGVELVGVHDLDTARAAARAAAWSTRSYASLPALVAAGANVIHVLTPPSSHADVALEALGLGCHVLVEKPLAESGEDARRIGALARSLGLVATVDHSLLHDPQVVKALAAVHDGDIGDVVGMDIFRSQSYPPYQGGSPLPHMGAAGYPWRDVGIHCLYLAEELLGRIDNVDARWLSLGGERNISYDEWAAVVTCRRGLARCQLTWNSRPLRSEIVIHGTRGTIRSDLFAMFTSRRRHTPLPKAAERFVNAYTDALEPLAQVPWNSWQYVRGRIRPYQAVRNSVADFYRRLDEGLPPAVLVEDAAVLVDWVERTARAADADEAARIAALPFASQAEFLVTGASGSVGSAVVNRLVAEGRKVRVLLRRVPPHPVAGVDYLIGNLGDPQAVDRAVAGVDVVIHAGAAMAGAWAEHQAATIFGTDNVIASCRRHAVRQLVHISSLSVVDWIGSELSSRPITEATPLEPHPQWRGNYTRAKLAAEIAVAEAASAGLPCVILRPGAIFGGGIPLITPSIARRAGRRWVAIGGPDVTVPLVYLDDVVDALLAAVDRGLTSGEVIHIVDEALTRQEIFELAGEACRDSKVVQVPRTAAIALGKLSEYPASRLGRQSPIAPYRLRAATARVTYGTNQAEQMLGWFPRIGVRRGIRMSSTGARTEEPAT